MNIKERCNNQEIYEKTLDKIAKDISEMDFSDLPDDSFMEGCRLLAEDLYGADEEEQNLITKIINEKYLKSDSMNTNPKRFEAIDRIVSLNKEERLELLGYLLAHYPQITKSIIEFKR